MVLVIGVTRYFQVHIISNHVIRIEHLRIDDGKNNTCHVNYEPCYNVSEPLVVGNIDCLKNWEEDEKTRPISCITVRYIQAFKYS